MSTIETVPLSADTLNAMGARYFMQGQFGPAEDCFQDALAIDDQHAGAWGNLGLTYQHCGFTSQAFDCYMRSYKIAPDEPSILTCLAFMYEEQGHHEAAMRLYAKALEINPSYPDARANLAINELMAFNFARGWELWESRHDTMPPMAKRRDFGLPEWDGQPTECLAIWPEQGIGDMILFSTLLPELIARGQGFVMECDMRLLATYKRSFPKIKFCPRTTTEEEPGGDALFPTCSAQVPLEGLARFLRPDVDSFGRQPISILRSDPVRRDHFKTLLPTDRKRIAISWRSFLPAKGIYTEKKKSGTLAMFGPLAVRADLALVDVQYGNTQAERDAAGLHLHRPLVDLFWQMDDVVALIDACDVVVTTCCVTAHIGGALGKPTYVMYPAAKSPLFSWQPHEGQSPWYPSASIVTSPELDTWDKIIAEVSERL